MAKDNPDNQTVPLYGANGNITGYTTPEKAEQLKGTELEGMLSRQAYYDAGATQFGMDDSYKKADGTYDYSRLSRERGAAMDAGSPYEGSGGLVFGGVNTGQAPTVDNPTPVPDTDFAGGMPGGVTQRNDGSWDWSGFGSGGNSGAVTGVDPGYQSTDWGGQESPWQGGGQNQDFYNQQFGQLLGQGKDFQQQQQQAEAMRQQTSANPPSAPNYEDMWAGMGVTPSQAVQGGPDNPYTWDLMSGAEAGQTTNRDLVNMVGGQDGFSQKEMGYWDDFWKADQSVDAQGRSVGDRTNWSSFGDPTSGISNIDPGLNEGWQDRFSTLFNTIYNRSDLTTPEGGGPTAAPGYALPVGV